MPVPQVITDKLGEICLVLPEVSEEEAWVGRRWMVRKKNFAQVLMIANGYPPTYARVAKWPALNKASQEASSEAICVFTFRTPEKAIHTPAYAKSPYFLPGWWPNIVGMVIDDKTNWQNIDRHINASYRALAPQKLINLL